MIEYKTAVTEDISSLKELWLNVFNDTETAVDLFFERKFTSDIAYIAKDGETLVSMLYLLPSMVNGHKACYLYAAATKKEYRNQGIMEALINFALKSTDYELCVALPATDSLYNFYSKFGFQKLNANSATLCREELTAIAKPYQLQDVYINGYCGIRNRVLKSDFLFWNNEHIDYACKYNEIYGAKVIKNNFGYAVAYEENGVGTVAEFICHDKNAPEMITDILSEFSSKEFRFHLSPNQHFVKSQKKTYGMVKYLSEYKVENIYCGLTLD